MPANLYYASISFVFPDAKTYGDNNEYYKKNDFFHALVGKFIRLFIKIEAEIIKIAAIVRVTLFPRARVLSAMTAIIKVMA